MSAAPPRHIVKGITIEANTSPCAHICRYCSIGDRGGQFQIQRWMDVVERMMEWARRERPEVHVQGGFPGPSYNFDVETFDRLSRWYARLTGYPLRWIPLGGLQLRPPDEMRRWFEARMAVGLEGISAALAGVDATHDRWNGRHGDFDFLMESLRIGAELGLKHGTTLFLTRSTLPQLEELTRRLDRLPTSHHGRYVRPFFLVGHGAHLEDERITEEDRALVPEFARESLEKPWVLRSEREWIPVIQAGHPVDPSVYLHVELTAANIERMESTPCDELVADMERRAVAILDRIPSIEELAFSDADSTRRQLYSFVDLERVWRNRFARRTGLPLEDSLLHYELGWSAKPPRLWTLSTAQ
jgi:hypothetical protein